ncbi:MAG TPA: hypothetical protein VM050_03575 [Patescibacteria group bacterium]|nr:hypothetical protein [Patescibacteria group bacterium]
MKAYSTGIKMAVVTALKVYNFSPDVEVNSDERGFTVKVTLDHLTDHMLDEIEKHVLFMSGQRIRSWDTFPTHDGKLILILEIEKRDEA